LTSDSALIGGESYKEKYAGDNLVSPHWNPPPSQMQPGYW
jgi:hypothetical protein